MPRNVEIKAKVSDLISLTTKAKVLSGDDGIYMKQEDTFFNAAHGRLKLRSVQVSHQYDFVTKPIMGYMFDKLLSF